MAAWVALIIILSLVSRFLGKKFGWRAPTRPQPPSLAEITSEAIDEEALLTPRVFRAAFPPDICLFGARDRDTRFVLRDSRARRLGSADTAAHRGRNFPHLRPRHASPAQHEP